VGSLLKYSKTFRKLNNNVFLNESASIIHTTDNIADQGLYIIVLFIHVPIKWLNGF